MQGDLGILREAANMQRGRRGQGGVSLSHEELDLKAGVTQQDPAQVAKFPSGHPFDVKDLDLFIENADRVAGGIIDLRNFSLLQLDFETELKSSCFRLRDEHELFELYSIPEGNLLTLLFVFIDPEVELHRLARKSARLNLDPQRDAVALEDDFRGNDPTDIDVGWGGEPDWNSVEGNTAFFQPASHIDGILAFDPCKVTDDHGTGEWLPREPVHRIFDGIADL